ncbi:exonuclease SbcCD subunit D [Marinilabilia salmonicolor]|jgi:exonuclease SbcD|uniref:Nuclease SbcCD subunit D n=1 Tax=Marinilabilia salmonicolor TaxID=989 RepID=A0A2T0XII0_9BACT|nr:exonuclease SbcCD subunit D [Marinilabilia salmonicolor]PRY98758.1 exodeoxyribonuclease I subunit D [Marinilabilia salmonicolor]RCW38981.1 exodeoxyribonuclease I subunit D [Marinilabilia salmonicolor]
MRILHTSDWHLGKRLESFSRLEEQKEVLNEICTIADKENAEAIVVAGDLFDTFNPSTEAVDLFYKSLKRLTNNGHRPVIAIAGNHDSPDRIEAPDPLARECGIIFAGFPNSKVSPFSLESGLQISRSDLGFLEIRLPGDHPPLRVVTTPYANELRLKTFLAHDNKEASLRQVLRDSWQATADKYCDDKGINLLITHLFMMQEGTKMPEEPEDEKPILYVGGAQPIFSSDIPENIQYTALGHLHRYQEVKGANGPAVYTGSPLAYSFAEANQQKYVSLIDAEPGKPVSTRQIELKSGRRLLRKRFEDIDQAIRWLTENQKVYVELTLVSDTYLKTEDRKRIYSVHDGIVTIIPEVTNSNPDETPDGPAIDMEKSMPELFEDFFIHHKGQQPNERIKELFKEIIGAP